MKGPYLTKQMTLIIGNDPVPDEDMGQGRVIEMHLQTDIHSDCLEGECAAWHDGKCHYEADKTSGLSE